MGAEGLKIEGGAGNKARLVGGRLLFEVPPGTAIGEDFQDGVYTLRLDQPDAGVGKWKRRQRTPPYGAGTVKFTYG
jgi:hypothetical protein